MQGDSDSGDSSSDALEDSLASECDIGNLLDLHVDLQQLSRDEKYSVFQLTVPQRKNSMNVQHQSNDIAQ